jgi:hypothetical protein
MDEGRTLNDVDRLMVQNHNFYASPAQWTTQLAKWGLRRPTRAERLKKRGYQGADLDERNMRRFARHELGRSRSSSRNREDWDLLPDVEIPTSDLQRGFREFMEEYPDTSKPLASEERGEQPARDVEPFAAATSDLPVADESVDDKNEPILQHIPTRKFECKHGGCDKRYSTADELYTHQLSRRKCYRFHCLQFVALILADSTPRQIYRCDYQHCNRDFVSQDLLMLHREQHTTHDSSTETEDEFQPPGLDLSEPSDAEASSKPTRRVASACDECRRKLIKCDGKRPCTHCTLYSYGKLPKRCPKMP